MRQIACMALLFILLACSRPEPLYVYVEFCNDDNEAFVLESNFPSTSSNDTPVSIIIQAHHTDLLYFGDVPNIKTYGDFCRHILKDYPDAAISIYRYDEDLDSKGKKILTCPINNINEIAKINSFVTYYKPAGRKSVHTIYWKSILIPKSNGQPELS